MESQSLTAGTTPLGALAVAVVCVMSPLLASAQEGPGGGDGPMTGTSEVLVGIGAATGPAYLGSDERKTRATPLIAARWSNGWFAGTGGIGYRFNAGEPLSWGLRVTLDPGRDESDAEALQGVGDTKARAELGAFASYAMARGVRLGASLRYGSGNDRDGLLMDVNLRGVLPVSESMRLTAGVAATFANRNAMQSQFGIDHSQSLNSGYLVYSPGGGLRDVSLQVAGMYSVSSQMSLMFGLTARTLMGDAKDSPLTRERTGVGGLISLSYKL